MGGGDGGGGGTMYAAGPIPTDNTFHPDRMPALPAFMYVTRGVPDAVTFDVKFPVCHPAYLDPSATEP